MFDKLLVLRALRPKFPQALFFTTDFDAMLTMTSELPYTRNLIISSSFGPELQQEIQDEIPPFRGSYQTAAFLASVLAIGVPAEHWSISVGQERLSLWLSQAQISEIERSGELLQFPAPSPYYGLASNLSSLWCDFKHLEACTSIQPQTYLTFAPYAPSVPKALQRIAAALLYAALLILLMLCVREVRKRVGVELWALSFALAMAGLICFRWPFVAYWLWEGGNGEPATLFEGVSIWPTVFSRAASIYLCFYFIVRAWRKLDRALFEIADEMSLRIEPGTEHRSISVKRIFSYRLLDRSKPYAITNVWSEYIYQNRLLPRLSRVFAYVFVMYSLGTFLIFPIFGVLITPPRGDLSVIFYLRTTSFSLITLWVLMFYVFDTIVFCALLVRQLGLSRSRWPTSTREWFAYEIGAKHDLIDKSIDLIFVEKVTKIVSSLIYYPFWVIALWVSGTTLSAAYAGANWAVILLLGIPSSFVIGSAVVLRQAAEAARDHTRQRFSGEINRATGSTDDGRSMEQLVQLQKMLGSVNALHEGAFRPITRQPVVRTLLLPVGGMSATILIEYVKQFLNL